MALQRDELREVIAVGGRTLEVIELTRVRADRAEQERDRAAATAIDWQARAIRAEASEIAYAERTRYWCGQARELAQGKRAAVRFAWACATVGLVVGILAAIVVATAVLGG